MVADKAFSRVWVMCHWCGVQDGSEGGLEGGVYGSGTDGRGIMPLVVKLRTLN
jgi:hypothetical protein